MVLRKLYSQVVLISYGVWDALGRAPALPGRIGTRSLLQKRLRILSLTHSQWDFDAPKTDSGENSRRVGRRQFKLFKCMITAATYTDAAATFSARPEATLVF